jgi:hypothetical protein
MNPRHTPVEKSCAGVALIKQATALLRTASVKLASGFRQSPSAGFHLTEYHHCAKRREQN